MTVPSSGLLAVCVFLPFVKVCGKPMVALQFPMFWTPYIAAGLILGAALSLPRAFAVLSLLLRIALWLSLGIWGFFGVGNAMDGGAPTVWTPLSVAAGIGILIAVLTADIDERVIARCGVAAGAAAAVWFAGVWASPDGLVGAAVSLVAACAMAVGCLWWYFEVPEGGPE